MSFYPEKIAEKIRQPQSNTKITDANGVGTGASFVCGTFIKFFLRVQKDTKEIVSAKYKTSGCGFVIASAEVLCAHVEGKRLIEFHGFAKSLLAEKIENELGRFPAERRHCLEICLGSLQSAFANFRAVQVEEFTGEKALICTCFGVSEETIEQLIKKNSLETVEDVVAKCSAGSGCGSCQSLIQDILDDYGRANF